MTEGNHGLKDLFGGAPDAPSTPTPAVSAAPVPKPAPTIDAPATSTDKDAGHGLAAFERVSAAPAATPVLEPAAPPPAQAQPRAQARHGAAAPIAVVIVALQGFAPIRRTIDAVRLQTVPDVIDLILVSPKALPEADTLGDVRSVEVVAVPEGASYGQAAATGMLAARSDLVALIDDYAFPARDWSTQVVAHQMESFAAMGSAIVNANPRSRQSWAHMLTEYGRWREGQPDGEVGALPPRNLVYRRDALQRVEGELAELIDQGLLAQKLAEGGQPLILDGTARIGVLNPSTVKGRLKARFAAGRLSAARDSEGFGLGKRTTKAVPALFGGLHSYRKHKARIFAGSDPSVNHKLHGRAVMTGLLAEGLGRAAGYLRGPGKAAQTRASLLSHRLETLNKTDRRQFGTDESR